MNKIRFRKKKIRLLIVTIALLLLIVTSFSLSVLAHSGRTDSKGGHYDSSTGEYHYHHGYPAHQHINGKCPFLTISDPENTNIISYGNNRETASTSDSLYGDILINSIIVLIAFVFLYIYYRVSRTKLYKKIMFHGDLNNYNILNNITIGKEISIWLFMFLIYCLLSFFIVCTMVVLIPDLILGLVSILPPDNWHIYIAILTVIAAFVLVDKLIIEKIKYYKINSIIKTLDDDACYFLEYYISNFDVNYLDIYRSHIFSRYYKYRIIIFVAFFIPLLNYYFNGKIEKKLWLLNRFIKTLEHNMGNVANYDNIKHPYAAISDILLYMFHIRPLKYKINKTEINIVDSKTLCKLFLNEAKINHEKEAQSIKKESTIFWECVCMKMKETMLEYIQSLK